SSALTSFSFPTTILFGSGSLSELPARLPRVNIQRPLVVTDPGLLPTEAFQLLKKTLGADRLDQDWFVFSGVTANPIERDVIDGAAAFRANQCDGVIAFGGG